MQGVSVRAMKASPAPREPQSGPSPAPASPSVSHDGREYPLLMENGGWRLRSKAKGREVNFRTGTSNLAEAKKRAKEYLQQRAEDPIHSRKGGGTLEALAAVYEATPKRTKAPVAKDNISRLRQVARIALGKELGEVSCKEVGPDFWTTYQRKRIEALGRTFDLATRHRENIAINAAVRAARCLFLPALFPAYQKAGLRINPDAGNAQMLPEPYVPPAAVNDEALVDAWRELPVGSPLWLVIGMARFAGLRREEISACRREWIVERNGAVYVELRDRPDEQWWTKTGKPYFAPVIEETVSAALLARPADALIVPDPDGDRDRWFEREPQRWLAKNGVKAGKPLHRLRGLYADHVAKMTADAVAARLAGVQAAQTALGHTDAAVTAKHYLSSEVG